MLHAQHDATRFWVPWRPPTFGDYILRNGQVAEEFCTAEVIGLKGMKRAIAIRAEGVEKH